jgi:tRNA threonylcarbamoyladenosine biosynthesis protein TsaB
MNAPVALAVCGSNLTGDVPFSCALRLPDRVVAARSAPGQRGDLAALVQQLCAHAGIAPDAIAEVRTDVGPGSYTGLRVAVTFVRVLQQFGGASVQAVDSLALLAARAARGNAATMRVRALLDARRDRVHVQAFALANGTVRPAARAAAVPLAQVLAELAPGDLVVVPEALPAPLLDALAAAGASLRRERELLAAELFALGLPFAPATAAELEPRYLMASYAE